MLTTKLTDYECFGLISTTVIYHAVCWFLTSQAVKERLLLFAIILLELGVVFLVSKPHSQRLYSGHGKQYRPHASYSLVFIFLVPLCVFKDSVTSIGNSDIQEANDFLWLSVAHVSVITSKFASLHERHSFLTYGCTGFIFFCLLTHLSSPTYIIFFILPAVIIWKSIDIIPSSAPKSFSFGEQAILLQLFCHWIGRISCNIHDQVTLNENDQIKWTGSTIVAAVILATGVMGITKGHRSLPACIFIYAVHAVSSMAFLTWIFKENFLLWLFNKFFQDCLAITLLTSWILVFAVAIIWTVFQALVITSFKGPNDIHRACHSSTTLTPSTHNIDDQLCDAPTPKGSVTDKGPSTSDMSKSFITYNTRKVFHFFILLVYVPGLMLDPSILFLSSCAAFGVFIIFEAFRVLQVPLVGQLTDKILRPFTDDRDQGPLFLTHIYLLVGLSVPLWITSSSFTDLSSPIRLYSGVLALGIGDTVACVAGRAFGKHHWPGTKKTVEGSISAIAAQMMFVYTLNSLDLLPVHSAFNLWTGVTVSVLVEAFTDQIDNLVLPLVLFPFLCSS